MIQCNIAQLSAWQNDCAAAVEAAAVVETGGFYPPYVTERIKRLRKGLPPVEEEESEAIEPEREAIEYFKPDFAGLQPLEREAREVHEGILDLERLGRELSRKELASLQDDEEAIVLIMAATLH